MAFTFTCMCLLGIQDAPPNCVASSAALRSCEQRQAHLRAGSSTSPARLATPNLLLLVCEPTVQVRLCHVKVLTRVPWALRSSPCLRTCHLCQWAHSLPRQCSKCLCSHQRRWAHNPPRQWCSRCLCSKCLSSRLSPCCKRCNKRCNNPCNKGSSNPHTILPSQKCSQPCHNRCNSQWFKNWCPPFQCRCSLCSPWSNKSNKSHRCSQPRCKPCPKCRQQCRSLRRCNRLDHQLISSPCCRHLWINSHRPNQCNQGWLGCRPPILAMISLLVQSECVTKTRGQLQLLKILQLWGVQARLYIVKELGGFQFNNVLSSQCLKLCSYVWIFWRWRNSTQSWTQDNTAESWIPMVGMKTGLENSVLMLQMTGTTQHLWQHHGLWWQLI